MSCNDQPNSSEILIPMSLDVGRLDCSKYPQIYVNYYLPPKQMLNQTQSTLPENDMVKSYFSSEDVVKEQRYSHGHLPRLCKWLIWGCTAFLLVALFDFTLIFTYITTLGRTLSSTSTTSSSPTQSLTGSSEIIHGIWNTTAGEDSTPSLPGLGMRNFYSFNLPEHALDQNLTTMYTHFGGCGTDVYMLKCGEKSGFYLTLRRGASLLVSVQFYTANYQSAADPLSITIEGSDQYPSTLLLGASWTLIYNGTSGLDVDPGRCRAGALLNLTTNRIWYASYRFLITSKRGIFHAVEFAEIKLIGY